MNSDCCKPDGKYDLAVIGAGSAGFSAAITAAEEGKRVALIGHGTIGGTCVNVGCVPSKTMIRAMDSLHVANGSGRFNGIEGTAHVTDWASVIEQKQSLVDDLRAAKYTDVLPNYSAVSYMEGAAKFDADGALTVDGSLVAADKIIIATGSRPHVPDIPGLDKITHYDSTSILQLTELPASLIVMGGGYIGIELAQIFARAGTHVTIVTRRGLLPEAEPEISEALSGYFDDEGIIVRGGLTYNSVSEEDGHIRLHVSTDSGDETITGEKLLLATGRVPNTGMLDIHNAGIETTGNGGIKIDPQMRTSRDGVYAVGDVTGRDQFVYMAAYGAKIAAKNAMNGNSLSYDNSAMPAVVFSDPQVASVGLTEAQAAAQGHEARTSVLPLEHVPRALAARDTRGVIKLVADGRTKKLLGAHILAPEGADSIQTAAMAIKAGMSYEDLGAMIFPYLTTVEGLKLAAQTFDQDVAKLSCCAG
ncbi:mercury(II) reductase [Phaeobacter gallaeciensis]|uniref:mercury(II) reductase n=1 Tax=Phaeobacter gallaeciensis TaxID=60890 RepID=UPI00237F0A22|nr:mercury(II) reductase [Phaeobacter gallaeciensis]MDE4099713.1 mercury(II) reductase [Phaeobacter gallaeciensis]MDE4108552.1 mercury(II) reductase [Phaeobacter gallaeciensis]MDE4110432.1 mercury(II) reductase [Phaeobacter gallaeciensis]MDE4117354.1 mercury(II) reductase [Phaeobacter gallaeciensis]MDE4121827.1 mercury(II) reductase [Phaeobacter gallaeciensis]